jgi:hypothetical protein
LLGVIPFLFLAVLAAAQLAPAGQALWAAGVAVRAGARAALVGRDPEAAARRALPPAFRQGAAVVEGATSVELELPRIMPALPPVQVGARTELDGGDG